MIFWFLMLSFCADPPKFSLRVETMEGAGPPAYRVWLISTNKNVRMETMVSAPPGVVMVFRDVPATNDFLATIVPVRQRRAVPNILPPTPPGVVLFERPASRALPGGTNHAYADRYTTNATMTDREHVEREREAAVRLRLEEARKRRAE